MAKRELEKYRVDADEPGMNVAGSGHLFGGESIIKPGTILTITPGTFEPRACMTPLNAAADAAFAKKRKDVEAAWRKSLPDGQDPDGKPLEALADGRVLSEAELSQFIRRIVAKVGPNKKTRQTQVRKARPKVKPGTFGIAAPVAAKPADTTEDDDALAAQILAEGEQGEAAQGQRATELD